MRSQHNITGSEAFSTRRPLIMREPAHIRRPWSLASRIYLTSAIAAVIAGLIDALTGLPICLTIGALTFLILWLRG